MDLTLNIYDKSGKEVVRVLKSSTYDLMFTTIRKIMAILKVESLDNNVESLKIICEAWDEVVDVLSAVFPDAEESDWDGVKVKEGSSAWNGFVPKLSSANTIGGGDYRAGGKYKGQLDDLCIYNRILSANEIKALHDAR